MPTRAVWILLLLGTSAGCSTDPLSLPSPPDGDRPPAIESFEPAHAFSGWPLRITGRHLGTRVDVLQVEFAGGLVVRAESIDGDVATVRVPDKVVDGPLRLITPAGRSDPSAGAFTFDGHGAPAAPQPLVRVDLRAELTRAVPSSRGVVIHDRNRYQRAAVLHPTGGAPEPLPGDDPIDAGRGGDDTLVLDLTGACSADLVTIRFPAEAAVETGRIELEEEDSEERWCFEPRSLASVPDGPVAVVASYTLWVVDPAATTPVRAALALPGDLAFTSPVVRAGPGRFAAGAGEHLAVATQDGDAWTLAVFGVPLVGDVVGLEANDSGRVVALTGLGELGVFDLSPGAAPPATVVRVELPLQEGGVVGLSEDGRRVAIAQDHMDRVVTWADPDGAFLPVSSVAVESPGRIDRGTRGDWLVAARGEVLQLSQETGLSLGGLRVDASLQGPVVRRLPSSSSGTVVEVVSTAFRRLRRLDAAALWEEGGPFPLGGPVTSYAGPTVGSPGGTATFVELAGLGLERWQGDEPPVLLPFPEGVNYGDRYAASSDESVVVATGPDPDSAGDALLVWDALGPPAPPARYGFGFRGYDTLFAGEGRVLAVRFARGFDLLDVAKVRSGEDPVVASRWFDGASDSFILLGAGLARGHAVVAGVLDLSGSVDTWVLRLSDGAEVVHWRGRPEDPIDGFVFGPSLRHHWRTSAFDRASRLYLGAFDIETGEITGGQPRTNLDGNDLRTASDGTGERLYVLDPGGETLTLVQ